MKEAESIYVKESAIVPKLDEWLARLFDPDHFDETSEALAMVAEHDDAAEARYESARRRIAHCEERLARYRALLAHDAPAAFVAGWMEEVEAEREVAARELSDAPRPSRSRPARSRRS